MTWLVFAFAALALMLLAFALYAQGRKRETQTEMLARLQMGIGEEEAAAAGVGPAIAPVSRNPLLRAICARLWRAGYEVQPGAVLAGLAGAAVGAAMALLAFGFFLGALLVLFFILLAHVVLLQLAGRWHRRVMLQLPDFLDHVLRALMAGNTLEEAISSAAREAQEPLRPLFLGISRQVRLGAPVEDALAQVGESHGLPDLHVLAMTARVNRRYGGSIRNMVKSIVQLIRQRETAVRELRALTMETRISAGFLAVIPLGITLYILVRNPLFYEAMWNDPLGRSLLIGGFVWQFVGMFVIWRMVRSVGTP